MLWPSRNSSSSYNNGGVNMSNTELKVIRAAIRSTRDLIQTLNDGREMPSQLAKIFFELNDDAIILSGMIGDGVANPIFSVQE